MSTQSEDNKTSQHCFLDKSIKDRFQIICQLGSGAYGYVWKVRCRQSKNIFAIKKVFLAFQNQIDAQRVYREIALLSKITHKNVIGLKSIIASQNIHDIYLLFEFMDSDVFKAIKNRVLDSMHKKYIVYQIACSLKYLHSAGVLHRDLKPSNVLIDSQCNVKVCDFGLSRSLESAFFNKPIMTEFIATRWYRSPEVLLGSRSYSTKSDMWSLGCLIYELYSRRTLLPGQNTIDQITKIVEFKGKPTQHEIQSFKATKAEEIISFFDIQRKPISFYYDDLQVEEVRQLLDHLLEYHPDKRWSAEELLKSDFLKEFRDPNSQKLAEGPVYLGLNDNRKYKLERYKEQISKSAIMNTRIQRNSRRQTSKRFQFSHRSNNNSQSKLSLHHGSTLSQRLKSNHLAPTLREKMKDTKKFQSACVSPDKFYSMDKANTSSLHLSHNQRGNSLNNLKGTSSHTKGPQKSMHFRQKHSQLEMKRKQSLRKSKPQLSQNGGSKRSIHQNGKLTLHKQSKISVHQQSKAKLQRRRASKELPCGNKQNYEQRLKVLKKTQLRHYRNQSQM